MIKINAKGLGKLAKHLEKDINRQVPFLLKRVLDETAYTVRNSLKKQLHDKIDKPTPFTQKAWNVRKSSKANLKSTVFLNPIQSGYLAWTIKGGIRRPNSKYIALTVGFKQNQYGNYPAKRKITQLLSKPNTFVATIKGTKGIWRRQKRGVKLLFALERSLTYNNPKLKLSSIHSRALKTTKKHLKKIIGRELNKIISKSRVFTSR